MIKSTSRSERPLRIAQVSPLYESVPSPLYGGTERVVSYLTEALARQGHQVTLFASGDSITQAKLVAACPRALRLDGSCKDQLAYHLLMVERVYQSAHRFDAIHFHIDYLHFSMSRRQKTPHLTTLHGRLDLPELPILYREFADIPLISISNAQRLPIPWANWKGTVYHGLPKDLHTFGEGQGNYLVFLGRTSPEKGLDQAIHIARRTGIKLKIAAKVDKADQEYFEGTIQPMLRESSSLVEFIGEVGGKDKDEFLRNARALLFPINWPEPFGLVMIEAMACGTPVIAYRRGSVPEVMVDGVTGFVVDNLEEAVPAVQRLATLDRQACRKVFEERYTVERMAADYVKIYRQLIGQKTLGTPARMPTNGYLKRKPLDTDTGTRALTNS